MKPSPRLLAFSAACFAFAATPAWAATHHRHHHVAHHTHHIRHAATSATVRVAQQHLTNLGYYAGTIDGLMGPQTRAAVKKFQYDKRLKVDGILGPQTNAALELADRQVIGTRAIPLQNIVTGPDANVNTDYVAPLNGGNEPLSSRFAQLSVSESGQGADKRYNVTMNGQPLLVADGQPSIIGMSPTYDLGEEDAIIFSAYAPTDTLCPYKTYVLALKTGANQMLPLANCTRDYQARVNGGSLFVSFPEHDDNRAISATWRVEGMTAERL